MEVDIVHNDKKNCLEFTFEKDGDNLRINVARRSNVFDRIKELFIRNIKWSVVLSKTELDQLRFLLKRDPDQ